MRELAKLSTALVIGLALGVALGRATTPPGSDPTASGRLARHDAAADSEEVASTADRLRAQALASALAELVEARQPASREVVEDLVRWGDGAGDVSRLVINEMSDRELISTITSLTDLTREDLEGVSNLREYANRLAEVAMSGVLTDPIPAPLDANAVEFATSASTVDGPADPRDVFHPGEEKIYAVFPTEGYLDDHVVVHWYHADASELLLFGRYAVNPGDDYSYVWLDPPQEWQSGPYRVEIFGDDESMPPLAIGSYEVADAGAP